ncbi:hypothetical protein [Variovorax sp. YR752]|uniref:hypothetical protein n=1 Tax=Variovorax sp. YR752 TaxID=1884383 RepID=UPI0031376E88
MTSYSIWIFLAGLAGALLLQAGLLRALHRRRLQALQSWHAQELIGLHGEFEQMRLRMLQLQREHLSQAQEQERFEPAAQEIQRSGMSVRQALDRQLDADADMGAEPSADGFEDTQIQPHEANHHGLLMQ